MTLQFIYTFYVKFIIPRNAYCGDIIVTKTGKYKKGSGEHLSTAHTNSPLPISPFLTFTYFCFVSWPTEFNQGSVHDYGFQVTHWSLQGSPMDTQLKTMAVLSLEYTSSQRFSGVEYGPFFNP